MTMRFYRPDASVLGGGYVRPPTTPVKRRAVEPKG